jgi:RsiW-degrading membrane proteinase PrsW (M82 family)
MSGIFLLKVVVSLLPVLVFLTGLIYLDSFKLVKPFAVIRAIGAGGVAALTAMFVNGWLLSALLQDRSALTLYAAPAIEEILKATFLIYLLRSHRIGFLVDAAIFGFGIGTGFSLVENVYYLFSRPGADLYLWVIRGFGTALMHGATTAIVGIAAKALLDRGKSLPVALFPGLLASALLHSLFNHFFISPSLTTVAILILVPAVMVLVFSQSERATRHWLGVGFDTDRDLLEMTTTGNLMDNKVGGYLKSLQDNFPGEVVADMLCMLRIHAELSVKAKGIILMREAGFDVPPEPGVPEAFQELQYLEKSIGKTGKLALYPFMHMTDRELWQLHMLRQSH